MHSAPRTVHGMIPSSIYRFMNVRRARIGLILELDDIVLKTYTTLTP